MHTAMLVYSKDWFTLPKVARLLGVHYMTVYRDVKAGRLGKTQVGKRRQILISRAVIEEIRGPLSERQVAAIHKLPAPKNVSRIKARLRARSANVR